jgi:hypothetical protein
MCQTIVIILCCPVFLPGFFSRQNFAHAFDCIRHDAPKQKLEIATPPFVLFRICYRHKNWDPKINMDRAMKAAARRYPIAAIAQT